MNGLVHSLLNNGDVLLRAWVSDGPLEMHCCGERTNHCGQKLSFSSSISPQGVAFRSSLAGSTFHLNQRDNALVHKDQNEGNNDCILKLSGSMPLQIIRSKPYLCCIGRLLFILECLKQKNFVKFYLSIQILNLKPDRLYWF